MTTASPYLIFTFKLFGPRQRSESFVVFRLQTLNDVHHLRVWSSLETQKLAEKLPPLFDTSSGKSVKFRLTAIFM